MSGHSYILLPILGMQHVTFSSLFKELTIYELMLDLEGPKIRFTGNKKKSETTTL